MGVTVKHGMPCSTMLSSLASATLSGLEISDYIVKEQTSCPSDLTVSILGEASAGRSSSSSDSGTGQEAAPISTIAPVETKQLSEAFSSYQGKLVQVVFFFGAAF